MLKVLNKIIKVGDKIYVSIAIVLLMVLVISVSAGIIARYFFNSPFAWTEELVTLLFIWISFLGAAVASVRKKHVAVDFLTARFSSSAKDVVAVFLDLFTMVFLVMVMNGAVILLPQLLNVVTVALGIPRTVHYLAVFVSAILIFLVHLESLIRGVGVLSGKMKREESQ